MNKSIFGKLFTMMLANILIFTILIYGANFLFARDYYVDNKKELLLSTSSKIEEIINDSDTPLKPTVVNKINALVKSIGGSVIIADTKRNIYLSEKFQAPERGDKELLNPFYEIEEHEGDTRLALPSNENRKKTFIDDFEVYNDNAVFFSAKDPELQIDTLRYQAKLDNEFRLLIWVPLSEINESISLSNRFTLIVALITMSITVVFSYFASKRFTKPIRDMNNVAKNMAELDFDHQLEINSEDEMGQLSRTINELSNKLSESIDELNVKNTILTEDIHKKEALEKMRKEFISNVSHELKTPIFLIQGYAEGLLSNIVDDEAKRSFYSQVIMEEADKMDLMVKDLLDISQLESGNYSVDPCMFNIDELSYDIIRKLTPTLDEHNIKLTINSDTNVSIVADPIRIEQVLINLFTNAINHCSDPNIIEFKLFKTSNESVKVSILNTGEPIPSDSLDKIWTSFYKVDEARTREYSGSGLGLSIVNNIIKVHHGNLGVTNRDKGVEFWFELDLANT